MIPLDENTHVRLAESGDDDALVHMSVSLYEEDPGARAVTADDVRRTLAHFRDHPDRGCVLVLLRGAPTGHAPGVEETPVGYAILCAYWSNELGGLIAVVDELYVQRDARGQGLSTAVFDALARGQVPRFDSLVAIDLEVTPDNARARALYARLGFTPLKNAHLRKRLTR